MTYDTIIDKFKVDVEGIIYKRSIEMELGGHKYLPVIKVIKTPELEELANKLIDLNEIKESLTKIAYKTNNSFRGDEDEENIWNNAKSIEEKFSLIVSSFSYNIYEALVSKKYSYIVKGLYESEIAASFAAQRSIENYEVESKKFQKEKILELNRILGARLTSALLNMKFEKYVATIKGVTDTVKRLPDEAPTGYLTIEEYKRREEEYEENY